MVTGRKAFGKSQASLIAAILGKERVFLVAARFRQSGLVLLVVDVRDPLEEQQRENVGLEVGRIHRSAQNVGGFPQMRFKLSQRQPGFDVVLNGVLKGR
jgi:hypothetical protein